jgi:outer membrane protein assembly factor BamB/ABC-type amino acid transport substrate-binding protein
VKKSFLLCLYALFMFLILGCEKDITKEVNKNVSKDKEVWSWEPNDNKLNGVPGEVSIKDGIVYFGGDDKNLYALEQDTGNELWNTDIRTIGPFKPTFYKDMIIISEYGGGMFGVNENGEQKWKFRPENDLTSQQFLLNDKVYVVEPPNKIHELNPLTGEVTRKIDGYAFRSDYVIRESVLFATDWDENKVSAIDLISGEKKWETGTGEISMPTSIYLIGDTLYIYGDNDKDEAKAILAIDAMNGKLKWKDNLKGMFYNPPSFTQTSFYYSFEGKIYEYDLTEQTETWQTETENDSVELFYEPENKLLFYREGDNQLISLNTEEKKRDWVYEHDEKFTQFQVTSENIFLKSTNKLTMIESPYSIQRENDYVYKFDNENPANLTIDQEETEGVERLSQNNEVQDKPLITTNEEDSLLKIAVNSQKGLLGSRDSFGYVLISRIANDLGYSLEDVYTNGIIEEENDYLRSGDVDIIFDHIPEGSQIIYSENYGERFEETFGLRERDIDLFNTLNNKLLEYKNNGTYQELFNDYYGEKFVKIGTMNVSNFITGRNSLGMIVLKEILSSSGYQYELQEVPTVEGYNMLLRLSAVDILPAINQYYDKTRFDFLLSTPYAEGLDAGDNVIEYSLAVNNDNAELLDILNQGIAELQRTGRLEQLKQEHGWR